MKPENLVPLLTVAILAGAYLKLPWLIYFAAILLAAILIAYWYKERSLTGVSYTRRFHYTRGFPGEKTTVALEVENAKRLPLSWLHAIDDWPQKMQVSSDNMSQHNTRQNKMELVNSYQLHSFEKVSRNFEVTFGQRGLYQVGPANLSSGDFFGLYEKTEQVGSPQYLTVFPEILPMEQLKLDTQDPFGVRSARKQLFDDPILPIAIREYQPEDGLKRIHWPATARTGSLQVKVYQPVSARVMMVCLNVATSEQFWLGFNARLFEQLLKTAASLCYHSIEAGYTVGLMANGSLAHSDQPFFIAPGNSPDQMSVILQALAWVTNYLDVPFEDLLAQSLTRTPYGASLVLVTGGISESLVETILRLKRYRPNISVFSLKNEPPPEIPGVTVTHLPFDTEQDNEH